MLDVSEQHLSLSIGSDDPIKSSFVYAKCLSSEQHDLWNQLRIHSNANMPWLVEGDFNTILRSSEKKGGVPSDMGSIQDFLECIVESNLSEITYSGN